MWHIGDHASRNLVIWAQIDSYKLLDRCMVLLSKVEKSSEESVEIVPSLSIIQALGGSQELEKLIGVSCASCLLKQEMQETKELMRKVVKQKLFKEKSSGCPDREFPWTQHHRSLEEMTCEHHVSICLTMFKGTEDTFGLICPVSLRSEHMAGVSR